MNFRVQSVFRYVVTVALILVGGTLSAELTVQSLRVEYLNNPLAVQSQAPRLSWRVEESNPKRRGQKQTAYRILVASSKQLLDNGQADLWDSQKVSSERTTQIEYSGTPLRSEQQCWWKVQAWDADGMPSDWSGAAQWRMGLLQASDWKAQWIAFADSSPIHKDTQKLELPPARHYRREIQIQKAVKQATIYTSALGNYRMYLNGHEVSDGYMLPGWSDYKRRAYYQAVDLTDQLKPGNHCLGAIVTEGWYAGYVGYGLLVGYGPYRSGKNFYGKTPALRSQLNILYQDGTTEIISTDTAWQQTADGPIREADIIMGERFEAQRDWPDWCLPSAIQKTKNPWQWSPAVLAAQNGSLPAKYFDSLGEKQIELGFQDPPVMQAYPAPPIRVVAELPAQSITTPKPGITIVDLGQNFAGVVRLKIQGSAGQQVRLRYGEMLHSDGTLMTENLRRARATDYYVCRGDGSAETWIPQFTYHGFRYVELTGLQDEPKLESITGLVLSNDLEYESTFECSDPVMNRFWQNAVWSQKANFIEMPTDCPQRDERLGWMGDAQAFVRTASYNANIAAFFTKWLDDVVEAQDPSGAYVDYAPYPMAHGGSGTHGTAWTDAGIICPWTIWKVYGDRRLIETLWPSMMRFMNWRRTADPQLKGVKIGNTWGDWLNVNEDTPIEYVDLCYHGYVCQLMHELASDLGKTDEAKQFSERMNQLRQNFAKQYVGSDGGLTVHTQTAYVLAISCGMLTEAKAIEKCSLGLAERIRSNGIRMTTGFLGTRSILPTLSTSGHHDLAVQLFQSRDFPSWGYEVVNGATSVWERWDSYTIEHGFDGFNGSNNAAMNSFNHYAFGAVMEWAFRHLVGIDTSGIGFQRILILPGIPSPKLQSRDVNVPVIDKAHAKYVHPIGTIECQWHVIEDKSVSEKSIGENRQIALNVVIPANTTAEIWLPTSDASQIQENQRPIDQDSSISVLRSASGVTVLQVSSGSYRFQFAQ